MGWMRIDCRGNRLAVIGAFGWLLLSSSSAAGETDLQALLDSAAEYRRAEQWDECLRTLKEAATRPAESAPLAALAQCRIGECLLLMAQPAKAEEALLRVRREFPEQQEAVTWADVARIDALTFQGRRDDALAVFEGLRQGFERGDVAALPYAWALTKAGGLHKGAGRLGDAAAVLALAESLDLDDPGPAVEAGIARCEILMEEQRLRDAAEALARLVEKAKTRYPHQANWARVRLAECLMQSWRYLEAMVVADEILSGAGVAAATADQRAHAALWKARSLVVLGEYEEAVDAVEQAPESRWLSPSRRYEVLMLAGEAHRRWAELEADRSPESGMSEVLHARAMASYGDAVDVAEDDGLFEDAQDFARLQLSTSFAQLGHDKRAIACLRTGIEDPADLSASDHMLAKHLGHLLGPETGREWNLYLTRPGHLSDPTAGTVAEVQGAGPTQPSREEPARKYEHLVRLAERDHAEKAYDRAVERLVDAESEAKSPRERGAVCGKLVECYRALENAHTAKDEREQFRAAMLDALERGVASWRQIVRDGTSGEAHGAIEAAVQCHEAAGMNEEALALAEAFVRELDPEKAPSKNAFAQFQRMRCYARAGMSAQELAPIAESICRQFEGEKKSEILDLAGLSLLWAAYYRTESGDAAGGLALLAEIEERWAGRFRDRVEGYRDVWTRR